MRGLYDDVIKWKHFPRYWPFARGFHRSPVKSPHKGQWRGALMFSVISAWINGWVNNREAGDLRRHQVHCDVIVMCVGLIRLTYTVYRPNVHVTLVNRARNCRTSSWYILSLETHGTQLPMTILTSAVSRDSLPKSRVRQRLNYGDFVISG